jgi:hypothetical protein
MSEVNTEDTQNTGDTPPSENPADKMYPDKTQDGKKEGEKTTENNEGQKEPDGPSKKTTDEADKKGEESKASDDEKGKVSYDDIVVPELPEGVQVDEELLGGVKEIATKHNLSKEAVQDLVNAYSKKVLDSDTSLKSQWTEIEQGWINSAKSDKEIGGDKFDETVTKARKAIDVFGTPALREALDQTRFGNHPELIRMMAKVEEKISEGGAFVKGDNAPQRTASEILYDKEE